MALSWLTIAIFGFGRTNKRAMGTVNNLADLLILIIQK